MAASLDLQTFAWVRSLASGDVLATAAADLGRVATGEEGDALAELGAFLADHLARQDAEETARHVLPGAAHLRAVEVPLPREDLPRSCRVDVPIELPCLVLPVAQPTDAPRKRDEAWVIVLPLRHTLYVKHGEDLDEIVRAEAQRIVRAREPTPLEYLELLPAEGDTLESLDVSLRSGEQGPAGRAASLRKALALHERRKAAVKILESVARPLHEGWEKADARRPLVGRDAERSLVSGVLGGKERLSCLLVGEPRVGKTALLRAFWEAQDAEGRAPLVYATSGAELVAGMSALGQWQERVRRVMEAAETLDAVLFFDDLGDLFAEHGPSPVDLAGGLKPFLEEGRVRVCAEIHPERLDLVEARNPSFFAMLHTIRVAPLGRAETLAVLEAEVAWDAKQRGEVIQLAALAPLVDLSARYLPYQSFPGKAIGLYRELSLARALAHRADAISPTDVYEAVSLRTGVPSFLLRPDRALVVADVEQALARRVVGQQAAVRVVAQTLCVLKAGLQPPDKPLATFLFVGPTGVGKTELARALAALLFGSEARLVRLDMSEYTDASAAARLFRGPSGEDGLLVRRVREQPFGVVLLDEIEKAHPSVHDLLLQVAGEGRLADARGRTTTFRETILVLTSNVGATERERTIGVGDRAEANRGRWERAVEQTFRPELVNRLDRIVVFERLDLEDARRVLRLGLERVRARRGLVELGVEVKVSPLAEEALVRGGFSPEHGARSLRRFVEDHLTVPLATLVARAGDAAARGRASVFTPGEDVPVLPGHHEVAAVARGGVVVRLDRRKVVSASRDLGAMDAIGVARLELARLRELQPLVALREQASLLRVELHEASVAAEKRRRRRQRAGARAEPVKGGGADLSRLAAEHARLSGLSEALDVALREALELEELAIAALIGGEGLTELGAEVRRVSRAFRAALAPALVALEPRRDAATLLLHELDQYRAFDHYLAPLLREGGRLGWRFSVHLPHEGGTEWPAERKFGPPRPPEALLERLGPKAPAPPPPGRPRSVVLQVRGPNAGVFLALEGGVHRFTRVPPELVETKLVVLLLALRVDLTEHEWRRPIVAPGTPSDLEPWRHARPTRDLDATARTLRVQGELSLDVALSGYWAAFEAIVAELLILCETEGGPDRSAFFVEGVLDPAKPDDDEDDEDDDA